MSEENSFQRYVSMISKIPLLTDKQEKDLTIQYAKNKTIPLRDKLISHNLRLVVKAAHKYSFTSDNVADLFQEGSIGLMIGVEKFDPTRGVRLGNYCYNWIMAYIMRYIINNARLVKIGTTIAQRKLFFNLAKTKAKYRTRGIDISEEDLAKELDVKPHELRDAEQWLFAKTISLDVNDNPESDKRDYIERKRPDIIEDKSPDPNELLEQMELKRTMGKLLPRFMNGLSVKDKAVFERRIVKYDSDTLDSIGSDLKLTRERIRQIETRLKDKFQRYLTFQLDM
ncbi:hypothetical protein LCGC14_0991160 [marine sediment metagenome]|uniref:RNA polymerase sigma-70 domain-containing protein n=1 Tax=marine sediment metagenome TaxID=412755 RepID=A0A0F9NAC7_9ZZZZ